MEYKDKLGVEIEVGDVIVSGGGSYSDIYIGMVTKRNPATVQTNGTGSVCPTSSLVITDLYKKTKPIEYQAMLTRFKSKFQDDAKVRVKYRYRASIDDHLHDSGVSIILTVIVNGSPQELKTDLEFGYGYKALVRVTDRGRIFGRGTLTDELRLGGTYPSPRQVDLPSKIVKKYFGGVPNTTEVVESFDNMDLCKKYLQSIGVTV